METVHEEQRHGLVIKISQDEDPQSPDEYGDDNLFLVGYHRDFTVERDKVITKQGLIDCLAKPENLDPEALDRVKAFKEKYHIFGLEAYIHSGVCLALSHEGGFPDRQWDVSQLGAVFLAKSEWKTWKQAHRTAQGHIEGWNDYLSGNVYGYVVTTQDGEDIESCWGFQGNYDAQYGALSEARSIVDSLTKKGKTDHKGQYLMAGIA